MSQEGQIGGILEPFDVEVALDVVPRFVLYLGGYDSVWEVEGGVLCIGVPPK